MTPLIDHSKRIEKLQKKLQPIDPQDTMAAAGRKLLLADFIKMLANEAGSREGADIEHVHDMRVATRRMRSAFRLLDPYFNRKMTATFRNHLRQIAQLLGQVRDLDVMVADMQTFQATLDDAQQTALQGVIDLLQQRAERARRNLIKLLDGKAYRIFIKTYGDFLTKPGKDALAPVMPGASPYQLRHLLPTLIHEQLGIVRAYETVLEQADDVTLHALRIEFKRLRYLVSFFTDVLGASVSGFLDELKAIQDHLGRLNDIAITTEYLEILSDECPDEAQQALQAYIAHIDAEKPELIAQFPVVWEHFNTRTVQRKLADALLVLR